MSRRKAWDQLSENYRARLERQGISRAQHESGAALHKARGKKSATHERTQRKERREINAWIADFSQVYGISRADIRQELKGISSPKLAAAIRQQSRMQDLYNQGLQGQARAIWDQRDRSLPEWMFYYHSFFR